MLLIRRTGLSRYSPRISQHPPELQLYLTASKERFVICVVAHARNPSTGGYHEVEMILSHTVSGKPNWDTGDLVSEKKNKNKEGSPQKEITLA